MRCASDDVRMCSQTCVQAFIMSKEDGWSFAPSAAECTAKNPTARATRDMLRNVEVMTCRRAGGPRDYEHRAMITQLLRKQLRVAGTTDRQRPTPL